jgi:DNA topoisomerase VI subunit A
MLGNDCELEGVPFLFMSDHGPHAMEIYSTLEYGSLKSAFVTMITTCLRLKWVEANIEFYNNSCLI